jgi:hypothetical protein
MIENVPEPTDRSRIVAEVHSMSSPLRLYWRDDAEARGRGGQDGEHWFDDHDADPVGWDVVCRNADKVFRVDSTPWEPLVQPSDPDRVKVRLIVDRVVRDEEYDLAEYDQMKADDELSHLIDNDVSDMDGDSIVIEADGTEIRPF